ncbi:MAG: hypothetical protein PARBA_02316 [Parabacteroides sp.]
MILLTCLASFVLFLTVADVIRVQSKFDRNSMHEECVLVALEGFIFQEV